MDVHHADIILDFQILWCGSCEGLIPLRHNGLDTKKFNSNFCTNRYRPTLNRIVSGTACLFTISYYPIHRHHVRHYTDMVTSLKLLTGKYGGILGFKNVSVRNGKYILSLLILFCTIYEIIIPIFSKVSNFLFVKYKKIVSISFVFSFTDICIRTLFVADADVRFWCRHPRMRMSVPSLV